MMKRACVILAALVVTACSPSVSDDMAPQGAEFVVGDATNGDKVPPPHPPQDECRAPEATADISFGTSLAMEATLIPDRAEELEGDVLVTPLEDASVLWGDVAAPPTVVHTASWPLPAGRYVLLLRTDGGDVYYPAGGPAGLYRVGDDDLLYMQCPSFAGGELREADSGVTPETLVSLLK